METLLITGIDTMLGANLALAWSDCFDVCGATLGASTQAAPAAIRNLGPIMPQRLRELAAEAAPSRIIHAGPLARSSWEPEDATIAWPQQAALAGEVAAFAREAGIPCCLLSTDAVFSGPRLFHEESARATGASPQAEAAREAEISATAAGALVVRTHAYGWSAGGNSWVDGLGKELSARRTPHVEGHHYTTPLLASDLAPLLTRAFERKLQGLYHITGAERTNRVRFVAELAAALGCEIENDSPWTADARQGQVFETSLNTRRARRDLDSPLPLLREGLDRLAAQRVDGFLDRLQKKPGKAVAGNQAA